MVLPKRSPIQLLTLAHAAVFGSGTFHRIAFHRIIFHRITFHRMTLHRITFHRIAFHRMVTFHRITFHRMVTFHRILSLYDFSENENQKKETSNDAENVFQYLF